MFLKHVEDCNVAGFCDASNSSRLAFNDLVAAVASVDANPIDPPRS